MDGTYIALDSSDGEMVCNLSALSVANRLRYHELRAQLHIAYLSSGVVSGGFALQLNERQMSIEDVLEWINLESLCCPWLLLEVRRALTGVLDVRMMVPDRAKQVLRMELEELLPKQFT
jgi:hypothetical protein